MLVHTYTYAHTLAAGVARLYLRPTHTCMHATRCSSSQFSLLTNHNVRQLNRDAEHVLVEFPNIAVLNFFFAATKDRAGGTPPGDVRHWKADVLRLLLQVGYLEWCGRLEDTRGMMSTGANHPKSKRSPPHTSASETCLATWCGRQPAGWAHACSHFTVCAGCVECTDVPPRQRDSGG